MHGIKSQIAILAEIYVQRVLLYIELHSYNYFVVIRFPLKYILAKYFI